MLCKKASGKQIMADRRPTAFTDFYANMEDEEELVERVGGTTLDLNQELIEKKVTLGSDAGHLAVQVSYKEKIQNGRSDEDKNWTAGTTIAVLSNFRSSENSDRSQIARATITLPRKKSTGKLNTPKHTSTHLLLTEKDEKWRDGIVWAAATATATRRRRRGLRAAGAAVRNGYYECLRRGDTGDESDRRNPRQPFGQQLAAPRWRNCHPQGHFDGI